MKRILTTLAILTAMSMPAHATIKADSKKHHVKTHRGKRAHNRPTHNDRTHTYLRFFKEYTTYIGLGYDTKVDKSFIFRTDPIIDAVEAYDYLTVEFILNDGSRTADYYFPKHRITPQPRKVKRVNVKVFEHNAKESEHNLDIHFSRNGQCMMTSFVGADFYLRPQAILLKQDLDERANEANIAKICKDPLFDLRKRHFDEQSQDMAFNKTKKKFAKIAKNVPREVYKLQLKVKTQHLQHQKEINDLKAMIKELQLQINELKFRVH